MSKHRPITIARIQTGGPLPPEDKMEFLWQQMAHVYGEKWRIYYGTNPLPVWCAALAPLTIAKIIKGIETSTTSGKEYPPTLPLFLRYCLDIREADIEDRCLCHFKSFDRTRMTREELDRVKNTRRPEAIQELIEERLGQCQTASARRRPGVNTHFPSTRPIARSQGVGRDDPESGQNG